MTHPNALTDPKALVRNRARATDRFLQDAARDEIEDRVAMVNKSFQAPVVVTPYPDVWQDSSLQPICVADAEVLDLAVGQHDLVIHSLGLHWSNDPVGQLIQCRRALRPDGLLLVASLGGQTLNELRSCLADAEIAATGGLSPRVAPMAELRDLGGLLQRAGLALPVADVVPMTLQYRDMWHLLGDLRKMGETNALTGRTRNLSRRAIFDKAAQTYRDAYRADGDGVLATFDMILLTGWAPASTQPQPLRPGSASARLADALGTQETSLPD